MIVRKPKRAHPYRVPVGAREGSVIDIHIVLYARTVPARGAGKRSFKDRIRVRGAPKLAPASKKQARENKTTIDGGWCTCRARL